MEQQMLFGTIQQAAVCMHLLPLLMVESMWDQMMTRFTVWMQ